MAKSSFPKIFDQKDKDGLIPLNVILKDFEPLYGGIFKSKGNDLILFAHPYFRRTLSRINNYNFTFLDQIIEINKKDSIKIKIALDEDLIGYAPSFKKPIELEYWWGPKFDEEVDNIPEGVTVHVADKRLNFFQGISKTEFRWKNQHI